MNFLYHHRWQLVVGVLVFFASFAISYAVHAVEPWQLQETRLCGPPKRNAAGEIIRSAAVRRAFMRQVWCPSTGLFGQESCPEHQVNHNIPLINCGCDSVSNMSLVHVSIKTCAASVNPNCIDRVEQKIWADGCRIWFESQGAFE